MSLLGDLSITRNAMIKSIDKALKIIDILGDSEGPSSVSEIARIIKADKSSVYRILQTLRQRGFVEQIEDSKEYALGVKILTLGSKLLSKMKLVPILRPFLQSLVDKTGETGHLAVLRDSRVVYIDRIECGEVLTVGSAVGNAEPIYSSATGKAILSFLEPELLGKVIESIESEGYSRFTDHTVISTQNLMVELENIKKNGFAVDNEERYRGVVCIAAPIKDYKDKVVTSLGISGPVSRMNRKKVDLLSEIVLGIAKGATEHLRNIHLHLNL